MASSRSHPVCPTSTYCSQERMRIGLHLCRALGKTTMIADCKILIMGEKGDENESCEGIYYSVPLENFGLVLGVVAIHEGLLERSRRKSGAPHVSTDHQE